MGANDLKKPLPATFGKLVDGWVDRQQGGRWPGLGSEQVPLGEVGHRDNLANMSGLTPSLGP